MTRVDFCLDDVQNACTDEINARYGADNRKYYIHTFGCQMNSNDSEKLSGMLEEMGFTAAKDPDEAYIVLLNTCCVREHAESKVFGAVGALCKQKRAGRELLIGICGCMMQQEGVGRDMLSRFPEVSLVFGTNDLARFPQLMSECLFVRRRISIKSADEGEVIENLPQKRARSASAWVSIMYGCNNFCTYCIVPYVRGRERSRNSTDIIHEINSLTQQGVREITLLGQNVNSYNSDDGLNFPQLLKRIDTECPLAQRVRFMTSHPKDLSQELIEVMAAGSLICRHFHLPVQSGSDRVLSVMNRRYDTTKYIELVNALRKAMPGIAITTDIIVGFPGESDEDFNDTLELVKKVRFDAAFTFKYSRRKGTPAYDMPEQVAESVKQERLSRLLALQNEISADIAHGYIGTVQQVLVDAPAPKGDGLLCGKTDSAHSVVFPGDISLVGSVVRVRIDDVNVNTLKGSVIENG